MTYKHFTIDDRKNLAFGLSTGISIPQIATELGKSERSIRREIARNEQPYDANNAQSRYDAKRARGGPVRRLTEALKESLEYYILELTWSPEEYAGRFGTVSFKTIYLWIQKGLLAITMQDLRHKGRKPHAQEKRGHINGGKNISERPETVESREEAGHWELDTVVGPRDGSKACVATFVERKSRVYYGIKIPDRTANSMLEACRELRRYIGKHAFKTATCDNGKEFAYHADIEKILGCDVYFADPFSSWQRGTNENSNGLLREFFPKGTDFGNVTQSEINWAIQLINNRPRKVLGFKTNYEVFMECFGRFA